MHQDRSNDMIRVAYFFAMHDATREPKSSRVPPQLRAVGIIRRPDAVEGFRNSVGDGREPDRFRSSLEGDIAYISRAIKNGVPLHPSRQTAVGDLAGKSLGKIWASIKHLLFHGSAPAPAGRKRRSTSNKKPEDWTREQELAVLRLYFATPYGKLHASNPEIIALAKLIGRTVASVAMKAGNFASLDPAITSTGRKGLSKATKLDREVWAEFQADSEKVSEEAESAYETFQAKHEPLIAPSGPTDALQLVKVRKVQAFFRRAVLASYDSTCTITGLKERDLLRASHILPWSTHPERRADPTNGLCLSALFDAAFDCGLITIDQDFRVVVSKRLTLAAKSAELHCSLGDAHGRSLLLPAHRRPPDQEALDHHRMNIFRE